MAHTVDVLFLVGGVWRVRIVGGSTWCAAPFRCTCLHEYRYDAQHRLARKRPKSHPVPATMKNRKISGVSASRMAVGAYAAKS